MPDSANHAIMAYIQGRHTACNNIRENANNVKHNKKGGCYVTNDYKKKLQAGYHVGFLQ